MTSLVKKEQNNKLKKIKVPVNIFLEKLLGLYQFGKEIAVHIQISIHTSLVYIQCSTKLHESTNQV